MRRVKIVVQLMMYVIQLLEKKLSFMVGLTLVTGVARRGKSNYVRIVLE